MAGDTPASDGPMLFRGPDVERGALRIFVARKDSHVEEMKLLQLQHAADQREHRIPVTAESNWIVVRPEELL